MFGILEHVRNTTQESLFGGGGCLFKAESTLRLEKTCEAKQSSCLSSRVLELQACTTHHTWAGSWGLSPGLCVDSHQFDEHSQGWAGGTCVVEH